MKNIKKKLAIIGSTLCVTCASIFASPYIFGNAYSNPVWQECAIAASYEFGTEFTLPQRSIEIGGTSYEANVTLRLPDGTQTTKDTVILNNGGIYTLSYVAVVKGKTYLKEETFRVDESYVMCGNGSSAVYGKVSNQAVNEPARALNVRLAQGDTLYFSQPIDLNNVTKNDVLVELMAKPDVLKSCDFTHLTVTFTDVENSDIYFSVIFDAYGGAINGNRAYTLACANGQLPKGYYYNRAQGTSTLNVSQSGTSTAHIFAGTFNANNECIKESLRISYDAAEKAAYINTAMIIDFDSPVCYPEGLWEGFSSGKVVMSMQADGYSMATANFNVYSAYGMNFQRNTVYVDKEAPTITVNAGYNEMPESEVGGTYTIPEAIAFDMIDGYVHVEKQVYFNYNSASPQTVALNGNTFNTDRIGYYAIVYTAYDYHGNSIQKILWVNSRDTLENPIVEILDGAKTTGIVGESIKIADINYYGGSGALTSVEYIMYEYEKLPVVNGMFQPQKAGTYTVWYEVTDFVGQTTKISYDVIVTVSDAPEFSGEAILPKLLISGSAYTIPEYIAYDYTSGTAVAQVANCIVDGKTYQAGETFTPTVQNNGDKVALTFVAGNTEKTYEIPCIIAWGTTETGRPKLQYENYWYSVDGTAITMNTGSGLQLNASSTTSSVMFANKLYKDMFALQLKGISGADNFEGLTVLLHDSVNTYETVAVKFTPNGALMQFTAGQTKYIDFDFTGEKTLNIVYKDGAFVANNTVNEIKETVYGAPFKGFSSGYVWVELRFDGVKEQAAVLVEKIGNHIFGSLSTDSIAPAIYMTADAGGVMSIGTEVTLPVAYAGDVLDPNINFTVTVTAPDGSILLDKADPTKEYSVCLNAYGAYYVQYSVSDTFNRSPNQAGYTYAFVVEDEEAPTLILDKKLITQATVGETYVLPNYKVSDNVSEAKNIVVLRYFVGPNGRMKEIPANSNSISFTEAGEYELYIMATDEAGNVTCISTVITVKEA